LSRSGSAVKRWLCSTSGRTYLLWPLLLVSAEAVVQEGVPRIDPWGLLLLAWGYLQYRLVGRYRVREGGGGPGIGNPPERLVVDGPYLYCRNPMYLGHLIFFAGLALALRSWLGAAVLAFHILWFHRRALDDEVRLAALFGNPYREYCARVRRWIPGLL
jgi:protein-S-isoprenylcysteine O-methyltransferase Ste14